MNTPIRNRIMSLLLSFVTVTTSVPLQQLPQIFSSSPSEPVQQMQAAETLPEVEDRLMITLDGERIDALAISDHEKVTVSIDTPTGAFFYRWQILIPGTSGTWVDIQGAEEDTLGVSMALVGSMIDENGRAILRCRATSTDCAYLSNRLTVTREDASVQSAVDRKAVDRKAVVKGEGSITRAMSGSVTPEFVTVTINYVRYDYLKDAKGNLEYEDKDANGVYSEGDELKLNLDGVQAFSPYVATLVYNHPLNTEVEFPTLVGYDAYFEDESTPSLSKQISMANVTENVVLTVRYKPKMVNFKIRYFFQNIYDDLYVENYGEQYNGLASNGTGGYTGAVPYTELLQKEFDGFTALYYQPDTIAADGSTIFEVYYERNYYLMEFDCDGGYGTTTLYNRFGSFISVPNPVKMGFAFRFWDLRKTYVKVDSPIEAPNKDVESAEDILPPTMPHFNSQYKAIWETVQTVYTVAYWIENNAGNRTYIGNRVMNGESSTLTQTGEALKLTASDNLCGKEEHLHDGSCTKICALNEHKHGDGGCICEKVPHKHSIQCYSDYTEGAVEAKSSHSGYGTVTGGTLIAGYLYRYRSNSYSATYYNYFYDGTTLWYLGTNNNYCGIKPNGIGNPSRNNVTSKPTSSTINCGSEQHVHGIDCGAGCVLQEHLHDTLCYSCKKIEHQHTASCRFSDIDYYEFVGSDPAKTIMGDGSTTLNVTYRPKVYEIRFVYARTNTAGTTVEIANYVNAQNAFGSNWTYRRTIDKVPDIRTTSQYYGKQQTFTNGNYIYYYISLSAEYGARIDDKWPADEFEEGIYISASETRRFGNWSPEQGTGLVSGDTSSVVGPYPKMSKELIKDPSASIAQRMSAFWASNSDGFSSHVYHIYYEALPGTSPDTPGAKMYNGKLYILSSSLNAPNTHKNDTAVKPYAYDGYEIIDEQKDGYYGSNTATHQSSQNGCPDDENPLAHTYCTLFYYNRKISTLSFFNYNASSLTPDSHTLVYGQPFSSLKPDPEKMQTIYYPSGLEPNAYEFAGWYTTPEFLPGTEMTDEMWNTATMPDEDLGLYAKWIPVNRTVHFYSAFSDIEEDEEDTSDKIYYFMYAPSVPHGTPLGSAYLHTPEHPEDLVLDVTGGDEAAKYDFVGWFYMDESNKKRFAPDSMKVTRNLTLFAEWQTSIDTTYEVHYVLKEGITDTGYTPSGTLYPAGAEVSDPLGAHASVGQTKTFEAPAGAALKEDFRSHFFPTINSHSILMEIDGTLNTYTFEYVYDDKVYYEIRYLEEGTGKVLHPSKVSFSSEAIITEKFHPVEGYIPTGFYLTRTLQYDGNATAPIAANIFTFYYVRDTEHGMYTIEHYLENEDSTDNSDKNNYKRGEYIVGTGDLNASIKADPRTYEGFVCVPAMYTVITYKGDGTVDKELTGPSQTGDPPQGIVTNAGLVIKIYYKRLPYSYKIVLREYETENILQTTVMNVQNVDSKNPSYRFESTVSATAENQLHKDGLNYYFVETAEKPKTQELKIRTEDDNSNPVSNVITFYYALRTYTVNYRAICTIPGLVDFGIVSPNYQQGTSISKISGATAAAGVGYRFVEWQRVTDETAITDGIHTSRAKITDGDWVSGQLLTPKSFADDLNEDGVITYYALFEPVYTHMTLNKTLTGGVVTSDCFLFHIKGQGKFDYIDLTLSMQGSDSLTIDHLPVGSYTVTELSWSIDYTPNAASQTLNATIDGENTLTFQNTSSPTPWLSGEDVRVNQFDIP